MKKRIETKQIILHCSATPEGRNIKAKDIRVWHIQNGWEDIGYHYIIDLDGTIEKGRPENMIGAHCAGQNSNSIGICYIGGCDKNMHPKNTLTDIQKQKLLDLVYLLLENYKLTIDNVHCHNEYSNKACPSFSINDFRKWYKEAFE